MLQLFKKIGKSFEFYKIVRVFTTTPNLKWMEIRHSCYIPLNHPCSIIYEKGKWISGDNLFVFTSTLMVKHLVQHVNTLAFSYAQEKYSGVNHSHFELWKCKIGTAHKVIDVTLNPDRFINEIEKGRDMLINAIEPTLLEVDKPPQVVTNKIKLVKKIYEHRIALNGI